VEPNQTSGSTQKAAMEVEEKDEIVSTPKDKFINVVCFNCSDVGHYNSRESHAFECVPDVRPLNVKHVLSFFHLKSVLFRLNFNGSALNTGRSYAGGCATEGC
jgi:hypothetical protein